MHASSETGVNTSVLRFEATNDAVDLDQLALQLTNSASSSAQNLTNVYLYDQSGNKLAQTQFLGATSTAFVTLSPRLHVNKDGAALLTIKTDIAAMDSTSASALEGAFIAVDYDGGQVAGTTTAYGSDGSTATNTTATGNNYDTATAGYRVFKSYPTLALINSCVNKDLLSAAGTANIFCFSVNGGPASVNGETKNGIALNKIVLNIATSSASAVSGTTTLTNLKVTAYTDAALTSPIGSGFTNGVVFTAQPGILNGSDNAVVFNAPVYVPAGQTYYFKVQGDITNTTGSGTFSGFVKTKLAGDASYPALGALMGVYATGLGNFVWSPNATTTSGTGHVDWTNGFNLPGLPSDYTDLVSISK